jgi:hypothetical protein
MAQNTKARREEILQAAFEIVTPEGRHWHDTFVVDGLPSVLAEAAATGARRAVRDAWRDLLMERTSTSRGVAEQAVARAMRMFRHPDMRDTNDGWGGRRRGSGAKSKPKPE